MVASVGNLSGYGFFLEYAWELRIIAFKKKRVLVTRESGLAGGTETLHWEKKQPEDKNC